MVVYKDKGIEVVPGITIPWEWFDGILCGIIAKGEDSINALIDKGIGNIDVALETLVNNNSVEFDNVGKDVLCKAVTLAFVVRYMPELLPSP